MSENYEPSMFADDLVLLNTANSGSRAPIGVVLRTAWATGLKYIFDSFFLSFCSFRYSKFVSKTNKPSR